MMKPPMGPMEPGDIPGPEESMMPMDRKGPSGNKRVEWKYRDEGQTCATCEHFDGQGSCAAGVGTVTSGGSCDNHSPGEESELGEMDEPDEDEGME